MTCLAELTDTQELKGMALEILARQLFIALRDAMDPKHPSHCPTCQQVLGDAVQLFKNLNMELPA